MTFTIWIGLRLYRVVYSKAGIRLEGKGPLADKLVTKDVKMWVDNT